MAVKGFRGKYKFLSNFYKCEVDFEGTKYPTAEHAFQAAKTFDKEERKKILSTKNPVIAKRMGRKVKLRPDWEKVKYEIMTTIVRQKFQNEEVKKLLLETGQNDIVEENKWHDKYWGKCVCKRCNGVGKNSLGMIIQIVRKELLEEANE